MCECVANALPPNAVSNPVISAVPKVITPVLPATLSTAPEVI